MKAVLDSNVYVSALAIPGGVAERALQAAMDGVFTVAISRSIITEVLGVLARKFARDSEELARTAIFLSSLGELVAPRRSVRVLRDEPDNRILECAREAGADVIVTGDREMLALGSWDGIRVLALREFVELLDSRRSLHEPRARYRAEARPRPR